MFIHIQPKIELLEIPAETTEKGRHYFTPYGKFASVTTILANEPKPHLEAWKKRVGEKEAVKILKRAGLRGTALHLCMEQYLNNNLDLSKLDIFTKDRFLRIKTFIDKSINNVLYQEACLYSKTLRTAGRVDLVAEYKGKLSIIDFKTKNTFFPGSYTDYYKQTTAYAFMLYELTGLVVKQGVVLYFVEDGEYEVEFVDFTKWYNLFVKDIALFYKE